MNWLTPWSWTSQPSEVWEINSYCLTTQSKAFCYAAWAKTNGNICIQGHVDLRNLSRLDSLLTPQRGLPARQWDPKERNYGIESRVEGEVGNCGLRDKTHCICKDRAGIPLFRPKIDEAEKETNRHRWRDWRGKMTLEKEKWKELSPWLLIPDTLHSSNKNQPDTQERMRI